MRLKKEKKPRCRRRREWRRKEHFVFMILMTRSVCVETLSARSLSLSRVSSFSFPSLFYFYQTINASILSFFSLFFFLFSFFFPRVLNVLFFPRSSYELFSTYKKFTPFFSLHFLFFFTFYSWLWNFVSTPEMLFLRTSIFLKKKIIYIFRWQESDNVENEFFKNYILFWFIFK